MFITRSRISSGFDSVLVQHCYVTGGSQGLGLCLSVRLAEAGAASVTIVARDLEKLKVATKEIEVRDWFSIICRL